MNKDFINNSGANYFIYSLATLISSEIYSNFPPQLTGRTKNSIRFKVNANGTKATIFIDPIAYDINKFMKKGIIVNRAGGYALKLNNKGSFWGNHKHFIDNAIRNGVNYFKMAVENSGNYIVYIE